MDGNKTISKVIPEGEFNCIWVEAGLVSYKLCDHNYECDDCPFDQVMRQKSISVSATKSTDATKPAAAKADEKNRPRQDTLLDVIRNIFSEPFSRKLPEDRSYSRGHVWIKKVAANTYRVGIDHYAADLLEGVGSVVFPQIGTSSVRDNPCAWIICDGGTIAVQSPVSGRIKNVNPRLMESAALVQNDPYESGWLNEMLSEGEILKGCVDASAMESMSKEQYQQLKLEVIGEFDNRPPGLGVTLMDGGVRPRNLKDVFGPAKYITFLQKLLSSR